MLLLPAILLLIHHAVPAPDEQPQETTSDEPHRVTIPDEPHRVTIPDEPHQVTIPDEPHQVTIPDEPHQVTIPDKPHQITAEESQDVLLPCGMGSDGRQSPTETAWRKGEQDEPLLRVSLSPEVAGSMGGRLEVMDHHRSYLLLKNLSAGDSGAYHCFSGLSANGSYLLNISGHGEQYIAGLLGHQVRLFCGEDSSSSSKEKPTWTRSQGGIPKKITMGFKFNLNGSDLLIRNLSSFEEGWYHCQNRNRTTRVHLRLQTEDEDSPTHIFPPGTSVYLPCGYPDGGNWISRSWLNVKSISDSDTKFNVTIEIRSGARPLGAALYKSLDLVIPSVTPEDAGVYNCSWGDNFYAIELVVIAQSKWQKLFGDSYWILLTAAGGSLAFSAIICGILLPVMNKIKAKRERQKAHLRRFFKITASGTPNTYTDVPCALVTSKVRNTSDEDGVSYENLDLETLAKQPKKLKKVAPVSEDSFENSEDEDAYIQPDNNKVLDSDDGDCYENTNEEVKIHMKDNNSDDGGSYLNPTEEMEEEVALDNFSTDGACYENPEGLAKMREDENVSHDGECYENSVAVSITGQGILSGFLAPNHNCIVTMTDPDGDSEKSTGSQSYEDMEGAIYMAPITNLQQGSDRSQEGDGDSYENMDGQALTAQLNQRSSRRDEEYEMMGRAGILSPHLGDQTAGCTQLLQEDGDFYLAFETQRPSAVQKIPSFKIEDHDAYEDMNHAQNRAGGSRSAHRLGTISSK